MSRGVKWLFVVCALVWACSMIWMESENRREMNFKQRQIEQLRGELDSVYFELAKCEEARDAAGPD